MPLQNRVDPFGELVADPAHGTFMGNRGGRFHTDARTLTKRRWASRQWICCVLAFKGRHREVWGRSYSELFFLDEATALAAGHRPCFECRREDFNRFKKLWIKANPQYQFSNKTSIREIDKILHAERINTDGTKKMYREYLSNLPDGTFISLEEKPYLLFKKHLYLWTPYGYEKQNAIAINGKVNVLTPISIVHTLRAGYVPQMSLDNGH